MKHFPIFIATAALLAAGGAHGVNVVIDAAHPGPVINEALYAQALGLGGGLWVGPDSAVPNIRGWRLDMLDALTALHVPVLRWPDGCMADNYHWRDGVGPREQRPLRRDPETDDNAVGTREFFDLVDLTGAAGYVSANVGTGSAREAAEWVEYMTAEGGSTLGQWRVQHGHPQPFAPRFVGVGQAPWGCGGNMTPQYYADLYNQYAVFIRGKSEHPPALVASGNGPAWTDELSTKKRVRDYRNAIGADAAAAPKLAEFIAANLARLDKNDPAKTLSLVIGGGSERDALATALAFHALHAHADRISMATLAAPLNSPQAMIRADGLRLILTPTYCAYKMHVPFQGATVLPVRVDRQPSLSVSAARGRDGKLYLSVVNSSSRQTGLSMRCAGKASGTVLAAAAPAPIAVNVAHGRLRVSLPPTSLTVLAIDE